MYNKQKLVQNQLFNDYEMFLEVLSGVVAHDTTLTLIRYTIPCTPTAQYCLNPLWGTAALIQDYTVLGTTVFNCIVFYSYPNTVVWLWKTKTFNISYRLYPASSTELTHLWVALC